ncbi:hypothetical protein G4G28_02205 [Massilia sp. Dwa41.01b]|uniref:hypothetical protein n=1 Tax=Massilia sp. Dwa41.01b TaxID=2709302 RepID=UPI0016038C25|nr:hypothetical protein [Massilia sp. Dwa41.01b]QNA87574.1 hypothetical protein G4G28_02205 [Massilia sp. Dwa41.01b]
MTETGTVPTLEQVKLDPANPGAAVRSLAIDPESAALRVVTRLAGGEGQGVLVLEPTMDENRKLSWSCSGENIPHEALPEACR